ncbi:MAG TPA: LptF/LptG family permease [Candidatus Angelobacter sp.]|nr:LptF/LptG family permease [Candidatus Angelobacter sp.]
MRIFTRYILKEVLAHGLIGASVFTFVVFVRLVSRIMELVVRNSAPVPSVAQLFFFTLPQALTITIPMGVLVGILLGLSRMAADSEVTAMRASGVSVRKFLKIVSIFGVSAWLLALGNTVYLAPRSQAALAKLESNLISSEITIELQPRVFYEDIPNMVLYVDDVSSASRTAVWKNVFLADFSNRDSLKITIAKEAVAAAGEGNNIQIHLINGEVHESDARAPNQYNITTFNETDMVLSRPAPARPAAEAAPVAQMSGAELLRQSRNSKPDLARWYWIEFNRRLALPTACLVLVLIGIPLGLSAKKGGKGAGFVLTIVLVFIYYFLSIIGVSMARGGKASPVLGVWMANIIFAVAGTLLLWRTDRIPIEIGLGQALVTQFKSWTRNWLKGRDEQPLASSGRRFFRPGLTRALAVALGVAFVLLGIFGPRSRWGGVGFSLGDEYFYPLLFLFVLGVVILLAQRFMLILDDYVMRRFISLLLLILFSFLAVSLVFSFFELLNDIVRNKVAPLTVGDYLLNQVPSLLYQVVAPMSVLLAVLVTFGLMQKSNEITAMKASGVSIYRTLVPILVIAGALAGGLFLMDQWYLPYANKRVEMLRNSIKGKTAQTYLRPSKWIFGNSDGQTGHDGTRRVYYYQFYEPERNEFAGISSFELDPRTFQISKRIYAARATWRENLQRWVFEKGWERTFNGDTVTDYRQFEVDTFPEVNEPPSYFKKEVRQSSEMNYDELRNYIHDLQQSGFDVVRLRVQLQKKLAFPLITLVMAVLAIPFGLSGGRRGALGGVTVALLIAVVYWVIAGLFEAMGNVSQLPPLVAAWMPDLIFGLVGGYRILKTPS